MGKAGSSPGRRQQPRPERDRPGSNRSQMTLLLLLLSFKEGNLIMTLIICRDLPGRGLCPPSPLKPVDLRVKNSRGGGEFAAPEEGVGGAEGKPLHLFSLVSGC